MTTDLLYSSDEESIREGLAKLLSRRLAPGDVAEAYDGDSDHITLWRSIGRELGLTALLVPEESGGAGASVREAAVVVEELGRAIAPVPYLTSAVVATRILALGAQSQLLTGMADGDVTVVLAAPLSASAGRVPLGVGWRDGRLVGRVTSVADANVADALIVPATAGSGELGLHVVHINDVSALPVVSLDMSRPLSDIAVDVAAGRPFLTGEAAENALRDALRLGAAMLASEQLGVARWCLDTTLAYVKNRYQFGRPIGSFQSLKHRLADLWLEVGQANTAARYVASCLAADHADSDVAVALAQAYCSDVAVRAAEEAIQMHAGLGMTWEHPAHLYLKRAKADQIAFGTAETHRTQLAALVDLPGVSR